MLNTGSHKDKNVVKIDNVILTCFLIKFTDIPLFILYMITCIETSSNEVSNAKWSSFHSIIKPSKEAVNFW